MLTHKHICSTLFPLPQKIHYLPGRWRCPPGALTVFIIAEDLRIKAAVLHGDVLTRQIAGHARANLRIIEDQTDKRLQQIDPGMRRAAYHLRVSPTVITLTATSAEGLFYGWQTVRQLIRGQAFLPCIEITDWPALAFRGYHLTLGNGFMPNPKTFRNMILRLASLKINHLVVEYDDRFPWQKHSLIPHPDAYSLDDLSGFVRLAQANFIEVIPLLDSLGHAGPYLAHKRYAHLAEGEGNRKEMCPANPQTLAFVKELWREVLAVHRHSRYAHISGDETLWSETTCARCRGQGSRRAARNYVAYYTNLSRWILEHGKQPMMWADMFIKIPETLRNFPRDVIMCDWYYNGHDSSDWSREDVIWRRALDGSMPRARQKLFEKYWQNKPGSKRWTAFPYTRFLQDHGFSVIGCTASSDFGPLPVASLRKRFWNNKWFALKLEACRATGLLCTHWSGRVPVDGAWPAIHAAADCSWHPRKEATDSFVSRVGRRIFSLQPIQTKWLNEWDQSVADHADGFAAMWPEDKNIAILSCKLAASLKRCDINPDLMQWSVAWHGQRQITGALLNRIDRLLLGDGKRMPVDLRPFANTAVSACMPDVAAPLPVLPGLHNIYGVPIRVLDDCRTKGHSALITRGARKPEGALSIKAIVLNKTIDRLFFLWTAYDAKPGCHIADLVAHYQDGNRATIPIIEGINISDWGKGYRFKKQALTVWKGNGHYLYLSWWFNPRPDIPLKTLDLLAVDNRAYLILLAVTAQVASVRACGRGHALALRRQWRQALGMHQKYSRQLHAVYRRMMSPRDAEAAMAQSMSGIPQWMKIYGDKINHP